jgi:hypothetical protein
MFTKKVTVNGFVNLGAALAAAGFPGPNSAGYMRIHNPNAGVVYVHLTNNGLTAPSTGADGFPISTASESDIFEISQGGSTQGSHIDVGTTWLYAAAPTDVIVAVN